MAFGLPDQHMVGKRHSDQLGQRTAIFHAANRLEAEGRAKRNSSACVGVPTQTAIATATTDLKANDDQIAWGKVFDGVADISYSAGGLVSHREGAGQARFPARDNEIEVASRYREGLYQRIPSVLQFRFRHIPPFDGTASDIG